MSSDEVSIIRLSRAMPGVWVESQIGPHIALPLARHAALMRVVKAACSARSVIVANGHDLSKSIGGLSHMMAAVDAYLATAPRRQGEAPR